MPPHSLGELARLLGAQLLGDPQLQVVGIQEPERAGPRDVALLTDPHRVAAAAHCRAGAFIVTRHLPQLERPQLVTDQPSRCLDQLLRLLREPQVASPPAVGIDPLAVVAADARVDPGAWVGPLAVVEAGAVVGAGCRILPHAYVGEGVRIGRGCTLEPGAVIMPGAVLGQDVVVHAGAVVGARGFGFWRDAQGWHPLPSGGGVRVADGVEIGACACVDAGTLSPTEIEMGAKLDNLVQVAHNCRIGARALLCGQVGLAGSVQVGDDAVLGGQVGVADHLRLGRGCRVAAKSGVAQDVAPGQTVAGYPAMPHRQWLRSSALLRQLGRLARQLHQVTGQVADLLQQR